MPTFWTVPFSTPNTTCHLASFGPKQTPITYVPLASDFCLYFLNLLLFYNCLPATLVQTLFTQTGRSYLAAVHRTGWGWGRKMGRWTERPTSNSSTSFLTQATCLIPWARCIFILAGIVAALRTAADNTLHTPKESLSPNRHNNSNHSRLASKYNILPSRISLNLLVYTGPI